MAKILSGKEIAEGFLLALREKIVEKEKKNEPAPGLAVIMIGNDPASVLYVRNKKKACHKVGIFFNDYHFKEDADEEDILEAIDFLNNDDLISGIIAQLPLPKKFNTEKIINAISPLKDVDGFHPENIKKLLDVVKNKILLNPALADTLLFPPVLKAVICLLDNVDEDLSGRKGILIAKNEIFARPLKDVVRLKGIDLEIVSPDSGELDKKSRKADVVITAVGRMEFIKGAMIREGSIIIDVGTTLADDGKLIGDVDFSDCEKKAAYISPVPGGVGPLTVAYLLENTIKAWGGEV